MRSDHLQRDPFPLQKRSQLARSPFGRLTAQRDDPRFDPRRGPARTQMPGTNETTRASRMPGRHPRQMG
jgi:hypothetical protein